MVLHHSDALLAVRSRNAARSPWDQLPTFKVRPCLPEAPDPLLGIAYNLRWSWDHAAIDLFAGSIANCGKRRVAIRCARWHHRSLLESAAEGVSFLTHLKGVSEKFERYLAAKGTWYAREHGAHNDLPVAYFSAEFGITECLSIFAQGNH